MSPWVDGFLDSLQWIKPDTFSCHLCVHVSVFLAMTQPPTPSSHPCYFHYDGCHLSFTCQSCLVIWWALAWGNTGTRKLSVVAGQRLKSYCSGRIVLKLNCSTKMPAGLLPPPWLQVVGFRYLRHYSVNLPLGAIFPFIFHHGNHFWPVSCQWVH